MSGSGYGFWSAWGTPANVDWCEPNYLFSPWIAEWWNTLSNAWMLTLGLLGVAFALRYRYRPRFALLFAMLALVGAGSAAFHGTLLRASQALDELPMVGLGLVAVWSALYRGQSLRNGWKVALAMVLLSVVFVYAYFTSPAAFQIFLLVYGLLVAWLVLQGAVRTFREHDSALMRRLYLGAIALYLGAWTGFWIPEHVIFGCDHPLQSLQLHAFWHIGAGSGTYLFLLWLLADDALLRGQHLEWHRGTLR